VIQLNPNWRSKIQYLDTLVEWAASRPEASFHDLWEEAIDPEWLPYLAYAGGATREQMVSAACAVARLCLHLIPEGEERPRIAIETAEAWAKGEATTGQVKYATAAYAAASAVHSVAYAVYSAVHSVAYAVYSATYAVDSAANAAYTLQAGIESQLVCATIRKHLVFERPPRPKGLTIWQRLAKESE